MKYLLIPLLMLVTISLGSLLNTLHINEFMSQYQACKTELDIEYDNSDQLDKIYACVRSKPMMKVLGTILFKDGSILQ